MKLILMLAALMAAPLAAAHGDNKHMATPAAAAEQTEWGIAGTSATRTVTIDMLDTMRFSPDRLAVKQGETVRFVIRNRGRMLHEMVIGTRGALAEHAALMAKNPGMEHAEPYMAHVDPGKSGEIVWTFNRPGSFEYACLLSGHYEAGMRGTIEVTASTAGQASPSTAAAPSAVAGGTSYSEGVIRKIDLMAGKVTLRHGRIANLDMPPMTMVFNAAQPALLNGLKVGDRVRFEAEMRGDVFVVTGIQPAP